MKKLRKLVAIGLCIVTMSGMMFSSVLAADDSGLVSAVAMANSTQIAKEKKPGVEIKAKAAVLMDVSTGKALLEYNEHQKLYPASVTKIMTLLLVMEALDSGKIGLTDKVSTTKNAASKGGSQIWLKENETMTVDELLRAATIASANDACTALAEYVAGSDEAFVNLMNEKAKSLGMKDTNFENCTGLDDDKTNHLTSAYDIALMSCALLKHEKIMNYSTVWMDSLRGGKTELVNTNKLVRFYKGCTGLKTGTTAKAGHCVAASAKKDGMHLVAVVMGSENSTDRFETAKRMLNWGFANWSVVKPQINQAQINPVNIIHGVKKSVTPVMPNINAILIPKGKENQIKQSVELTNSVEAPAEKGQILGYIYFKVGDNIVGKYSLTLNQKVERMTFIKAFIELLKAGVN